MLGRVEGGTILGQINYHFSSSRKVKEQRFIFVEISVDEICMYICMEEWRMYVCMDGWIEG